MSEERQDRRKADPRITLLEYKAQEAQKSYEAIHRRITSYLNAKWAVY